MVLQALLLCRDPESLRVLRLVLGELGIAVEVETTPPRALETLTSKKFDAVILDLDDMDGSKKVLQDLRRGTSNRTSITFAVTNRLTDMRSAFQMGANFVLDKPLTPERTKRCFRAAHGLLVGERRRYFRCPVDVPVWVAGERGGDYASRVQCQNVSEGGMAVQCKEPMPIGRVVQARFELPGLGVEFDVKCEVAWSDSHSRCGLRFVYVAAKLRQQLQNWLNSQIGVDDSTPPLRAFSAKAAPFARSS